MKKRVVIIIGIVVFLIIFAATIYRVMWNEKQYSDAITEYNEVGEYVSEVGIEDIFNKTSPIAADVSYDQLMAEAEIPNLKIDFDGLSQENPDFLLWLYMPGLRINYPVCQTDNNDFYLHHTFQKAENKNGCIYMSANAPKNLTGYNSMIYGHNMRNGTMFGNLKLYMKEDGTYGDNEYFYIYTDKASYKYRIYSFYRTKPNSNVYGNIADQEAYDAYINMALSYSLIDCGVEVDHSKPTITLSTCSGTGANKVRFVLHGIQEAKIDTQAAMDAKAQKEKLREQAVDKKDGKRDVVDEKRENRKPQSEDKKGKRDK